jgi:transposase
MLISSPDVQVFVAATTTDMRKGCFSLAALVQQEFELDPKSNHLFVFFGKGSSKVKILHWDRNGFVMTYKCLADGRFRLPKVGGKKYKISMSDLNLLLEGIDLTNKQRLRAV